MRRSVRRNTDAETLVDLVEPVRMRSRRYAERFDRIGKSADITFSDRSRRVERPQEFAQWIQPCDRSHRFFD
jgi:hypothetical protein